MLKNLKIFQKAVWIAQKKRTDALSAAQKAQARYKLWSFALHSVHQDSFFKLSKLLLVIFF